MLYAHTKLFFQFFFLTDYPPFRAYKLRCHPLFACHCIRLVIILSRLFSFHFLRFLPTSTAAATLPKISISTESRILPMRLPIKTKYFIPRGGNSLWSDTLVELVIRLFFRSPNAKYGVQRTLFAIWRPEGCLDNPSL